MTAKTVYTTGVKTVTAPLLGTERVFSDNGSAQGVMLTTQQIADLAIAPPNASAAYNTNSATASTTLTAANITGGTILVTLALTGTIVGAANAQLPTVASVLALLPNVVVGQTYQLDILNDTAGEVWTITTNTGWTITGTATLAGQTGRYFLVTVTSLTNATATLQNIGSGTI